MKIIGICGGSGSGKSKICEALEKSGAFVINADAVARGVTNGIISELTDVFGKDIINEDKTLNRTHLSAIVFNAPEKLSELNKMTHPKITGEIMSIICKNTDKNFIIIDAAALIESELYPMCDYTVAVYAPRQERAARIIARDSITASAALVRINAQPDDGYFIKNCDLSVYNDDKCDVNDAARKILNFKKEK